jgi:beta-exotoxin I transport system ATP-binding protein
MLLRTEKLTKNYGDFRALDSLDLEVTPGEVFGLLGPNGSGKSTALRLMLGFLQPTSGRAVIAGHDCWQESVDARRHVAYLPGELRLYENMTGRQLVRFLSQLRTSHMPDAQEDAAYEKDLERLARAFDIDVSRPIADLSSGMKRKVALLQVLLPRAPLLILDEPTNTLDPTMRDELLDQIRDAGKQGQAVLFSSHVLSEVERVCDRVGILQRGRLVHVQNMTALREGRLVRATFAGPFEPLPPLEGVGKQTLQDDRLTLEYTGPLPPLLAWLSRQNVRELQVEPLGLGSIYHRFHGNGA